MMTSERMFEKGLNFAAVHDSYWTHACDVDQMNRFIREEFIKLYEDDPLVKFKECLEQRFPFLNFPDLPPKGELDLKEILNSTYFFS
jgi:DNA-directed RNA polymerase